MVWLELFTYFTACISDGEDKTRAECGLFGKRTFPVDDIDAFRHHERARWRGAAGPCGTLAQVETRYIHSSYNGEAVKAGDGSRRSRLFSVTIYRWRNISLPY